MEYEINEGTLAIVPENNNSIIYEDNEEYHIKSTPFEIVDHSCKYFGSSYEGRKEGAKSILNISYKVPIIIENTHQIIFFPTISPIENNCYWISLRNIKEIKEKDYNSTTIIFKNNKSICVPVSRRSIENQIFRASRLNLIMRDRDILYNEKVI